MRKIVCLPGHLISQQLDEGKIFDEREISA